MKTLIFAGLLLPLTGFGQTATVKDFNFSYTSPLGEGAASHFEWSGSAEKGEVRVFAEKNALDQFHLKVSGSQEAEFDYKEAPEFLTSAENVSISDFNLSYTSALEVTLGTASFSSSKNDFQLKNFSLNCSRGSGAELMDEAISGCLKMLRAKSSKFTSQGVVELQEALGGATISDLNLKISNGKYDLAAEIKAQVSGKLKSTGQASYDATSKTLTIKISEVKLSYFDVTGEVFSMLKEKESEKMKVKKPYVYLSLK